jgi:hypothetical protein
VVDNYWRNRGHLEHGHMTADPASRVALSILPARCSSEPPVTEPPREHSDPLRQVDEVIGSWANRHQAFTQRQAEAQAARKQFEQDANELARTVIRPTCDAIAARLDEVGGGGRVDERSADVNHYHRLTLWMSLEGDVVMPRQERNPYLQVDLDVPHRRFNLWEGDMWEKQGGSGNAGSWKLGEITDQAVIDRAIAILSRAVTHDVVA